MRAASTACTLAGTSSVSTGAVSRYSPALPWSFPDSISACTTSSVKNGLPPVRAWIMSASPAMLGSEPSRLARSWCTAWVLSGASGSCW